MCSQKNKAHLELERLDELTFKHALTELGLSTRARDKILRVVRTIADPAGEQYIRPENVSEAIMYRRLERHTRGRMEKDGR